MSIEQTSTDHRFGGRATIDQPGVLEISGYAMTGVINNVGLAGAHFTTELAPPTDSIGTLRRFGGRAIAVRVVRQTSTGVGLVFRSSDDTA